MIEEEKEKVLEKIKRMQKEIYNEDERISTEYWEAWYERV